MKANKQKLITMFKRYREYKANKEYKDAEKADAFMDAFACAFDYKREVLMNTIRALTEFWKVAGIEPFSADYLDLLVNQSQYMVPYEYKSYEDVPSTDEEVEAFRLDLEALDNGKETATESFYKALANSPNLDAVLEALMEGSEETDDEDE